ncbi:hypothetical protein K3495_g9209 [Podosphaera aphanis]|nr:hypothetical protein K3495_g9209 [Podosphaera aphanis]
METYLRSKGWSYICASVVDNFAIVVYPAELAAKFNKNMDGDEELKSSSGYSAAVAALKEAEYALGYVYQDDEASAWYEIHLCLDDIDLDFVKEFNTTNSKWNALIKKYTKFRPATNRETVKKITVFTFEPDETLERGWTRIREYRRRVVEATPQLAKAYSVEYLFDFFMQALPPEYKMTRQIIDGQPFLPVLDKLDVLYRAEDEIRTSKDKEIAMAARYKDHHLNRSRATQFYDNRHGRNSSSDSYGSGPSRWTCEGRHPKHDCPYQEAVEEFAIALRIRDERLKAKNRVNGETQSKHPDNTSKGDYR